MFDRVKTGDRLSVEMRPAVKVLCASCARHLYYLKRELPPGEALSLGDLAPAAGIAAPTSELCPVCRRPFRAWFGNGYKLKTDRGYL